VHEVTQRIRDLGDFFREQALESDRLGRLSDAEARALREVGVIRMLQPKEFGGMETSPVDFFEAVMEVGRYSPPAGWIAGVVGVHPFEFGQLDHRVQEEIWGKDPDTWTASPYAPLGRARPVEGGFIFNGRWPFSSGTDHCDWVVLGGMVTDQDGNVGAPPEVRHFILPRGEYEILHDSWQVMGLSGTGSKDVVVKDAFVPEYRTVIAAKMQEAWYAEQNRPGHSLYRLPFGVMFPAAINASTLGICQGAIDKFVEYTRGRVSVMGVKTAQDPFHVEAIAEALADMEASRRHFLGEIQDLYDHSVRGGEITMGMRLQIRCNEVRAVRRVIDSVDNLFNHAGGHAIWLDQPMQRFWRDMHAAMGHVCNVAEPMYVAFGQEFFGGQVPAGVLA
jgi:alkylation response protein AidB-like acyl-CoA dehydrogenase